MLSFGKKKKPEIDLEQHELLEYAHKRIKQKKKVFSHFVVFLIGSVFLILANKVLNYGEVYDWSIWIVLAWAFFLVLHVFNVFVTHKFMGQNWERHQRERLVALQKKRIDEIQKEIETDFPLSKINKKKDQ
nr:2TM domain-containing protein [uncultured Allomuricauda sp.]